MTNRREPAAHPGILESSAGPLIEKLTAPRDRREARIAEHFVQPIAPILAPDLPPVVSPYLSDQTDLDAKAAVVCSGCASVVSPYLGGLGRPTVIASSLASGILTVTLAWSAPSAFAQALSNGANLVTSYAVFYRHHSGPPPPATGDPTGWSLAPDLQSDGAANGGFSTNLSAQVEVAVPATATHVTFAIGLNFDGSGNPSADADTRPSAYLSDQSEPVLGPGLFADGFESGDVAAWSDAVP